MSFSCLCKTGPLSHVAIVDTGGMWNYWKRKQLSERTLEDTGSGKVEGGKAVMHLTWEELRLLQDITLCKIRLCMFYYS